MNIKHSFPIFKHHPELVYLDSAASAQKPHQVIDAMKKTLEEQYANVHRGLYPLSEHATELYENTREKVRSFIGARSSKEIIFTKNATEAINLVAYSWGLDNIRKGDVIVVSELEHHSNYLPWQFVADKVGAELIFVTVNKETYQLHIKGSNTISSDKRSLQEIIETYGERVKLIAIAHVSNVLGTIQPINEIVALARTVNARVMVDGCQAVAHVPVDVLDADVDFYVFSGHKLYGPTGVGVLYAKRDHLEYMHPFLYGGEMVLEVKQHGRIWKELPLKFEAGTPPIVEVIGMGAAIDFIRTIGFSDIQKHEKEVCDYAIEQLSHIDGVTVIGPEISDDRIGVVSFVLDGIHPHDIAQYLGEKGICIRAGHHCCQILHQILNMPATARMSLGMYSRREDINLLKLGLEEALRLFRV